MSNSRSAQRHPLESLTYLILMVLAGAIVGTLVALVIGASIYGSQVIFSMANPGQTNIGFLKVVQICSSVGMFIVPSLFFTRIESKKPLEYLGLDSPTPFFTLILSAVIVFCSGPVLEWVVLLNQQMKLPGFLQGLEEWMRNKEDQMKELTEQFLTMKSPADLLINMIMVAIIPAIGEELIFRCCLQKTFIRWTKSYHAGIWITAIIFSAIHVQFYGFFPRMFLGALFGYLYVWGKSLWFPITGHFINNGFSVVMAYVYQIKGEPLSKLDEPQTTSSGWPVYLASLVLTAVLLQIFYKKTQDI